MLEKFHKSHFHQQRKIWTHHKAVIDDAKTTVMQVAKVVSQGVAAGTSAAMEDRCSQN
jgi:hypothetical protein